MGPSAAGTNAVEGATGGSLARTIDTASTATIEIPHVVESVATLISGDRLTVIANGKSSQFDMAETAHPSDGLVRWMMDTDT